MKTQYGLAIGLLAGVILAVTGMVGAEEPVSGIVVALAIEKCTMTPGSCEGSIAVGDPGHARTFQVKGGVTTIRKGGKQVVLQEVRLGDRVRIEVVRQADTHVAKAVEVTASDQHSGPSDRH
jgi:hypothetical protein